VAATPGIWAVIPAAGTGRRFHVGSDSQGIPKQYSRIAGKTVLEHSAAVVLQLQGLRQLVIAVHPTDTKARQLPLSLDNRVCFVAGGDERSDSVLQGLLYLYNQARDDDWVLVHDAARPCVSVGDLQQLVNALHDHPVGGVLAVPVVDTLKREADGNIVQTVDRQGIWQAQTPQMFRFGLLLECLQEANNQRQPVTDEASAIESCGYVARIVEGSRSNIKITYPDDLALAAFYLQEINHP